MSASAAAAAAAAPSAFAPLHHPVFRRLWGASTVSNLGFWMQQVAAAWLMTQLTDSAALVALLATAAALPTFLLALPAGALADVLDRRRMIIATQTWQLLVAAGMGVLALTDAMTPGLLLAGMALYGLGATLGMPPQQAVLPELVDREQLSQAVALNATGFTVAQAVGPALGGATVAGVGPGWAFLANAASFVGVVVVFLAWRREAPASTLPAEHVLGAIRSGARYVRYAPAFQIVLLRQGLYVLAFAAFPALLVVAVREQLGAGAGGYGIALGAFGAGGVLAALVLLPRLRGRVGVDRLTAIAGTVFAVAGLGGVAVAPSLAVALPGLVLAGAASLLTMVSLSSAAQSVLPDWVRGRGLAISQLVFQASMAVGAAVWGALAVGVGVTGALLGAAGFLVAALAVALAAGARLGRLDGLDLRPAPWAGEQFAEAVAPDDGPVVVMVEYDVPAEDEAAFVTAMREVARTRRRDGAIQWSLATDLRRPELHVETFALSSWAEYERLAERVTGGDVATIEAAARLHRGEQRPVLRHLLGHHGRLHLPHPHLRPRRSDGARRDV